MTILLYSLLLAFILIITPLVMLMRYLLTHATNDPQVSEMRRIIFVLAFSQSIFILAQLVLIVTAIFRPHGGPILVTWAYSISTFLLAAIDWWALLTIRKIIQ